jgi:hypothetical protein
MDERHESGIMCPIRSARVSRSLNPIEPPRKIG